MKRITSIILLLFIALNIHLSYAELNVDPIIGSAAILIDGDTGQIVFEKNMHELMFPASTTKILTAIMCLEDLKLDDIVTVDEQSPYAGGSHIALEPGEELTVEQLVNALMLASANDAAEALAIHHSGSIEAFAEAMNQRAAEMGALNSNFTNPHGLHDVNHVTTAYDLSIISKYAMTNKTFRTIIKTLQYEIPITNLKKESRYLNNGTSLFHGMAGSNDAIVLKGERTTTSYSFATGIKRGFTPEARYCFVGSSTVDGRNFISVVLQSDAGTVFQDTRILLELGATETKSIVLSRETQPQATVTINRQKETKIIAELEKDVVINVALAIEPDQITSTDVLDSTVELPVSKGEVVGSRSYYLFETLLLTVDLVSDGYYVGEDLLNDELFIFENKQFEMKQILKFLPEIVISLLLWRTIMTFIKLSKRKVNRQ